MTISCSSPALLGSEVAHGLLVGSTPSVRVSVVRATARWTMPGLIGIGVVMFAAAILDRRARR